MIIRDKIAEIIEDYGPERYRADERELHDVIIESLPGMVLPLVWVENDDQGEGGEVALSSIGHAFHAMTDGWAIHMSMNWNDAIDLKAAKAAAQAHHEAQVMAAFGLDL